MEGNPKRRGWMMKMVMTGEEIGRVILGYRDVKRITVLLSIEGPASLSKRAYIIL